MTPQQVIAYGRSLIRLLIDSSDYNITTDESNEFSIDLLMPIDEQVKDVLYGLILMNDSIDVTIPETTGLLMLWSTE